METPAEPSNNYHKPLSLPVGQTGSFCRKVLNKFRRFYLCNFRKDYIKKQEAIRMGNCLQCGRCCQLVFRCPFLKGSGENIYCQIYHKGRPAQCKAFPIDEIDLTDVDFQCGYSFKA